MECGALVGIQTVTSQLAACHPTDRVNEVSVIEIFKPILIQVVGVGVTVEVMGRGILDTIFIASVLWEQLEHVECQV